MDVPWSRIVFWALAGTVAAAVLVLANLSDTREDLGDLVDARPGTPAAPLLERELGADAVRPGGGHDGAYFYAVARDPFDLETAAANIDAPRYRLQRIVYPLLAWALHPTGGGPGLVWSMFAVGVLATFAGGVGAGVLSVSFGGPTWPAVTFGLLPGTVLSLRISVADPLALALAVWALIFARRGAWPAAVMTACAAVLTREVMLLVLIGFLVYRHDRKGVLLVVVPATVSVVWAATLYAVVPSGYNEGGTLALPFTGLTTAVRFWLKGYEPLGFVTVLAAVVLGLAALRAGGWGHPLTPVIIIQLVLLVCSHADVLAPERNGSRVVMPLLVFSLIVVANRSASSRPSRLATSCI
jgi:hypothetical protein